MSGVFYCRSEFTAPWGLGFPPMEDCLMFHVVTTGRCWPRVEGPEFTSCSRAISRWCPRPRPPAGERAGGRGGEALRPAARVAQRALRVLRHGGSGAPTTVICGVVRFDHPAAHILSAAAARDRVDAWSSPETEWIQSTLRFMAAEARELRPGGETVITRLADILVIQAIRSWMAAIPPRRPDGSARCRTSRSAAPSR